MVGSCVWKPGDKQANPTSCIPMPSLAVMGVREGRELSGAGMEDVFVFRSSLRGRCLELPGNEGDEGGSFLTVILGGFVLLPDLGERLPSTGDLSFGVLATGPLAMAESVLSMEGAAAEGARLVYRGLWRSKEGREPSEAEATAVDMVSTEDGRLYSSS